MKNLKLLCVEDDKNTIEIISSVLDKFFDKIFIAYDGKEGFELFNKLKPDIVITDIQMPDMDGLEMSKKIREVSLDTPLIILTGNSSMETIYEAIDIGVDGFVNKPLKSKWHLLKVIKKAIKLVNDRKNALRAEKMLQIQSKTAAIGDLISNIAHQWRQPLTSLGVSLAQMELNLALGKPISEEFLNEHIKDMENTLKYLSTTIDDFRSFFHADQAEEDSFEVSYIVEKSLKYIDNLLIHHKIKILQNNDSCQDVFIYGNENRLIQAILNILNNAKDVMEDKKDDEKFLFIDTICDQENIQITIKDSGGGIDETIIDKIFEPYFTTKHQAQDVGIGLYMTFEVIVKQLNGRIEVSNEEYVYDEKALKGAQFKITIPRS